RPRQAQFMDAVVLGAFDHRRTSQACRATIISGPDASVLRRGPGAGVLVGDPARQRQGPRRWVPESWPPLSTTADARAARAAETRSAPRREGTTAASPGTAPVASLKQATVLSAAVLRAPVDAGSAMPSGRLAAGAALVDVARMQHRPASSVEVAAGVAGMRAGKPRGFKHLRVQPAIWHRSCGTGAAQASVMRTGLGAKPPKESHQCAFDTASLLRPSWSRW